MSDNDKTERLEPVVAGAPAAAAEEPVADAAVLADPVATADSTTETAAKADATTAGAPWTITITADAPATPAAPPYVRPRTRWAAIVWGLIIAGIAATTLAVVSSPERRLAVSVWAARLTPGAFWILSVLVVGVFILILAVLALIRHAQRRRRAV